MKRVYDIHYNKPICFSFYFFTIIAGLQLILYSLLFDELTFTFWLIVLILIEALLLLLGNHVNKIKMIEFDNERLIIHIKNRVINIKNEDIQSANMFCKDGIVTIKILTENETFEIKSEKNEALYLWPFLLEIAPFIKNCNIETCKNFDFSLYNLTNNVPCDSIPLVFLITCIVLSTIFFPLLYKAPIAETGNVENAKKILDVIFVTSIPTVKEYNEGNVKISLVYGDKCETNYTIIKIANSEYFDKDVHFIPNDYGDTKKQSNIKKHTKWLNKILTKRIKEIPGVFDYKISLNGSSADIFIYTTDDFDKEEIKKIVKNIIIGTTEKYKENNINIAFMTYKNADEKLITKHKNRHKYWFEKQ